MQIWKSVQYKEHRQAQLGVPNSRKQVELGFILQAGTSQILNFAQNPRQSQSVQGREINLGGRHRTEKVFTERGGHGTYFLNRMPVVGGGHGTCFFEEVTIGLWENHIHGGWGGDSAHTLSMGWGHRTT